MGNSAGLDPNDLFTEKPITISARGAFAAEPGSTPVSQRMVGLGESDLRSFATPLRLTDDSPSHVTAGSMLRCDFVGGLGVGLRVAR